VRHRHLPFLALALVTLTPPGVALLAWPLAGPEHAIRSVLETQQAAWNRGDVEAFMSGYDASEATTFVGASVTRGYKQVLEDYRRRYPTRAKMGQLNFTDLEVKLLGTDYASVIGKWHLTRAADSGGDASGIFTLLLHKTGRGWKIILDHTS
jgi:uncharacterized protein (TIGR02246 family)